MKDMDSSILENASVIFNPWKTKYKSDTKPILFDNSNFLAL